MLCAQFCAIMLFLFFWIILLSKHCNRSSPIFLFHNWNSRFWYIYRFRSNQQKRMNQIFFSLLSNIYRSHSALNRKVFASYTTPPHIKLLFFINFPRLYNIPKRIASKSFVGTAYAGGFYISGII